MSDLSDFPPLRAEDQQRIDMLVESFRLSLEATYRIAYAQGEIDQSERAIAKMKARTLGADPYAERREPSWRDGDMTTAGEPMPRPGR